MCWCDVNLTKDLKCQILSSLTLEFAFKYGGPKVQNKILLFENNLLKCKTKFFC